MKKNEKRKWQLKSGCIIFAFFMNIYWWWVNDDRHGNGKKQKKRISSKANSRVTEFHCKLFLFDSFKYALLSSVITILFWSVQIEA